MKYDFCIVGAGFFGAVCAHELNKKGYKCVVIDKRTHIAGNCYTRKQGKIHIHEYGPHIFNTNSLDIWNYVNTFTEFNQFIYSPVAKYRKDFYALPFNMWTFNKLWGVQTPQQALDKIDAVKYNFKKPENLEEYALSALGPDIYEKLIKHYTKKQWQCEPSELPSFIIKRLPFRLTYNSNYYNTKYCGIPKSGYTEIFQNLLQGIEVRLETDYFKNRKYFDSLARNLIYTGKIDEYFDYKHGNLDYRTLNFKHQSLDVPNFQGVPVINHTCDTHEYTRTIEHKHFDRSISEDDTVKTIITYETPIPWEKNMTPYYPINTPTNNNIYKKYNIEGSNIKNCIFGGRLAKYKYYNMDQIIGSALKQIKKIEVKK